MTDISSNNIVYQTDISSNCVDATFHLVIYSTFRRHGPDTVALIASPSSAKVQTYLSAQTDNRVMQLPAIVQKYICRSIKIPKGMGGLASIISHCVTGKLSVSLGSVLC